MRGRPPLVDREARTVTLGVRVSPSEWAAVTDAAEAAGVATVEWCRGVLVKAAGG